MHNPFKSKPRPTPQPPAKRPEPPNHLNEEVREIREFAELVDPQSAAQLNTMEGLGLLGEIARLGDVVTTVLTPARPRQQSEIEQQIDKQRYRDDARRTTAPKHK